jgi:hypothetical protein
MQWWSRNMVATLKAAPADEAYVLMGAAEVRVGEG